MVAQFGRAQKRYAPATKQGRKPENRWTPVLATERTAACPVEIKNRSKGFGYQVKNYPRLPRVVVFCLEHDVVHSPEHVDVLEIAALAKYFTA